METQHAPPTPAQRLLEDRLHARLDGQLPEAERSALDAELQHHPEAQATLTAWQSQREALRALHADVLDEPVPSALRATLERAQREHTQARRRWRWTGWAAVWVMTFMAGWLARSHTPTDALLARWGDTPDPVSPAPLQRFSQQAGVAYAVYSPEVKHPVEVDASQQQHLVQWLSKRLGRPLTVPDLSSQGFALVGGRLLPGEHGARAQFMYQNPQGLRLTLYLGAIEGDTAPASAPAQGPRAQGPTAPPAAAPPQAMPQAAPDAQETAFRFSDQGPVPSFYWVDQGFGYALSAPLSRQALLSLATLVYQQR
ncbi:anti-sigma factor [Curvibacter sp. HBC61]|uniref:Anti-sigma factor n=1 Tax=Curvibacter cyanobacteriorum TaxID=3026422 RepID=A0ABT5MVG6_9BURK|nr:anti-sigma factor [Curvibacter sp. HBC61]MDD0837446.1 anti-sigma factor [Curvibacter sp. HBC61]